MQNPRRYHLVSPPFVCGLAWFTNFLAAAGVKLFDESLYFEEFAKQGGIFWEEGPNGTFRLNPQYREKAAIILPSILEREDLRFIPGVEVGYSHRIDRTAQSSDGFIVIIRDPRDSLYSSFRRDPSYASKFSDVGEEEEGYARFLTSNTLATNSLDLAIDIPLNPLQTYNMFVQYWLLLSHYLPVHFVKFEDAKQEPLTTAKRLLDIIQVPLPESDIRAAINACDLRVVQRAEQRAKELYPGWILPQVSFVRRGKTGEWRERNWPKERELFERECPAIFRLTGYEPFPGSVVADPDAGIVQLPEPEGVLAALQRWLESEIQLMGQVRPSWEHFYGMDNDRIAALWANQCVGKCLVESELSRYVYTFFFRILSDWTTLPPELAGRILRRVLNHVVLRNDGELNTLRQVAFRPMHI